MNGGIITGSELLVALELCFLGEKALEREVYGTGVGKSKRKVEELMGGEKLKIFFCFVLLRKLKYTNDLQPNGDAGSS